MSFPWKSFALLLLTGCGTAPAQWAKVDGTPLQQVQFQLDQTDCQGELQKASLSSSTNEGEKGLPYNTRNQAMTDAYAGCMAGKGYVHQQ
jgi:hypothetical protein